MDAKGAQALVERLAREGRYAAPAGVVVDPEAEVTPLAPVTEQAEGAAPGPAERAA